jgi:small subunit ribosomal protein S20
MANTKSAEKRNRQSLGRRDRNRSYRTRMRSAVKRLRQAISGGENEQVKELLPKTLGLIDETAQKKVIHRNAAARTKSRLTRAAANLNESSG